MRISHLLATLAFPALAGGALAQQPASPDPKELLTVMSTNVMRISPSLEYDRWDANVVLWQMRLKYAPKPDAATLNAMRATYQTMCDVIAQIRSPDEKGRWVANRTLWEAWFADEGMPTNETKARLRPTLAEMRTNISAITAPGEAERWRANFQLWNVTLMAK